ncbi:MAG TPA: hypothetical protein VLC92_08675 [Rhodocyclaceae bacterium]|nr:hypothetical protein [Rhodocyclaceae bacterium]
MSAFLRTLYVLCLLPIALSVQARTNDPIRHLPLRENAQLATAEGRMYLKYFIGCALPSNVLLETELEGEYYEFPGSLGLAPDWQIRGLNAEEERWVSACIFARTNFFGEKVQISMTSPFVNTAPGLDALNEEPKNYPVEEGTYFGNLFAPVPVAYVCGANELAERQSLLGAHKRICALPLDKTLPDGRQVTACSFIYLGQCTAEKFNQAGVNYQQAITVHLPQTPATSALHSMAMSLP